MVVWWLCWHRTILMRNIRQKQYSHFPPVPDFGKLWWGMAYVPCMTNLRARYAWVIRWHVTCMLSLAEHWQDRRVLSNRVCAHSVISIWHVVCLQHLVRACSEQSRSTSVLPINHVINAYQDLWIMTIGVEMGYLCYPVISIAVIWVINNFWLHWNVCICMLVAYLGGSKSIPYQPIRSHVRK